MATRARSVASLAGWVATPMGHDPNEPVCQTVTNIIRAKRKTPRKRGKFNESPNLFNDSTRSTTQWYSEPDGPYRADTERQCCSLWNETLIDSLFVVDSSAHIYGNHGDESVADLCFLFSRSTSEIRWVLRCKRSFYGSPRCEKVTK